jgi:uncharacterized protein YdeI (YjbR/CyaY-like superfamily)
VEPTYFASPGELRDWLDEHHATVSELIVGFWKKGTGRPSVTWEQVVEEALCVGWIDGIRRGIDDERSTIRLTPRRKGSNWSAVNIAKVAELRAAGRMRPAGEAAFAARRDDRSAVYSYEQRHLASLVADEEARFRANQTAWHWFEAAAPSYRQAATHWVVSAKRPETRARRLDTLIEDSAAGRRIGPMRRPSEP